MTDRRSVRRAPLLSLLLATCGAVAVACAGHHARQDVLLPTLRTAWDAIKPAVARQIIASAHPTAGEVVAAADAALQAGTAAAIAAVDWSQLEQLAAADTARREAAGTIGPAVAASLRERLTQFTAARGRFTKGEQ